MKSNEGMWSKDADGEWVPPPKVEEYGEWLLEWPPPADGPQNDTQYGELNDVNPKTLKRWRDDPRFQTWVEERGRKITESYHIAHKIFQSMADKAISQQSVEAAKLCLQLMGRFEPSSKSVVRHEYSVEGLDEAQIMAMLQRANQEAELVEAKRLPESAS